MLKKMKRRAAPPRRVLHAERRQDLRKVHSDLDTDLLLAVLGQRGLVALAAVGHREQEKPRRAGVEAASAARRRRSSGPRVDLLGVVLADLVPGTAGVRERRRHRAEAEARDVVEAVLREEDGGSDAERVRDQVFEREAGALSQAVAELRDQARRERRRDGHSVRAVLAVVHAARRRRGARASGRCTSRSGMPCRRLRRKCASRTSSRGRRGTGRTRW